MIYPQHLEEWRNSAVAQDIIELNVRSLSGNEAYEAILYALPNTERRNDGRLRDYWLRKYHHFDYGGWHCTGVDVITLKESQWGCFKPNKPRVEEFNGFGDVPKVKTVKYEHPVKTPTEIFALKVPRHIWQAIAERYGLEIEGDNFWDWVIAHPEIPIILVEGAKKAGAVLTANYIAIALPGIFSGYRQPRDEFGNNTGLKYLIPQLEVFAVEGREFYFCFDNDQNSKTIQNVRTAITNTSKLLIKRKCTVKLIQWNFKEKGVDDLIAARGTECFDLLYETASTYKQWQKKLLFDITPYVSETVCKQYLEASDINPPDDAVIIGIKSFKGTNKTGSLAECVRDFIADGKRVLGVVHRQQLAAVNASRFGVDYLNDLKQSFTQSLQGYFLCHHSLHPHSKAKFDPHSWDQGLAVFDEIEQVIWDLLDSSLIKEFRILIIETLASVLQNIVRGGGKIYIMDADLSPISIQFLYSLLGEKVKTWVLHNTYLPTDRERHLYVYNNPKQLVNKALDTAKKDQKIIVHTSGQKHKSKFGTRNLEALFNKECFGKNILRIDGESTRDPNHPAYRCIGSDLNKQLIDYDIVITSPSLETGVSIDVRGHFNAVFGIAQGVQTVNSFCQTIERIREDIPRHIFVAPRGLPSCFVGNGSTDIKGLLASTHQLAKAHISLLAQLNNDGTETEYFDSPLITWAKLGVLINQGMLNYQESILEKLEADGYEILEPEPDEEIVDLSKEITESRDKIYQEYCHDVPNSYTLSPDEFNQLQNQQSRTEDELLSEKKFLLNRNYQIEVTPELVEADDDGLSPKLKLLYYSTIGREYLPERDKKALASLTEYSDKKVWKPDLNKRLLGIKVKLVELFLSRFLEGDSTFTPSDLQAWHLQLYVSRHDIKTAIGVTIKEDSSPIRTANALLALVGAKLAPTGEKRGVRGEQEKVYKCVSLVQHWADQIFPAWLERDKSQNVSSSDTVVQNPYINRSNQVCTTDLVCTTSQIESQQLDLINPVAKQKPELNPPHSEQSASLVGRRARAFATRYNPAGEGVIVVDRGYSKSVEIQLDSGRVVFCSVDQYEVV
ncbi:hypothetical protein Cri9333_4845 (plasmid) [Crinalium epipsammum PCC 9333]|uniref:DUF3854 domain-containing protein n=1 Tax=Crinalium epipsammum PCC 9333 TaxID=1173022 RepID=K9W610_9CYAN|nr:plasmid replication protein, CyRepA1 family [Crinalium epipsammum]AFZ15611.1 hypothetical protein Cri9333_4845 [Crinalium epipsammum PCC 9333]